MRLGVSPAAAPTHRGIFNQRFEALFPPAEPWVAWSALLPAVCLVYLCANVGLRGATRCSACPVLCHSESGPLGLSVCECGAAGSASGQTACPVRLTLRQSRSCHSHASPLLPGCPSLPLLPVWMNVYFLFPWCRTSLPLDFLSILVVRGGAVCLPMLPSWFSPPLILKCLFPTSFYPLPYLLQLFSLEVFAMCIFFFSLLSLYVCNI